MRRRAVMELQTRRPPERPQPGYRLDGVKDPTVPRLSALLLFLCLSLLLQGSAEAQDEADRGWNLRALPADELYRVYVADPTQSRFGLTALEVTDARAAESGTSRSYLRLGGIFGLLRLHPAEEPDRGWQLSIEAGFNGQFDIDNDYDNIGWDGIYGLWVSGLLGERTRLRAGVRHISSHVGDELAERTGRRRINYTREETALGVSHWLREATRVYVEGAWGHDLRNEELQRPGRAQIGIEHDRPAALGRGFGWYVAADVNAYEESDWSPDATIQIGLLLPSERRGWRLGMSWRDGRIPVGEFFQEEESYVALGVWLDP